MEAMGLEINETKGMFLENQDFFQIWPSSLVRDSYSRGQVRLHKDRYMFNKFFKEQSALVLQGYPSDLLILVEIYVIWCFQDKLEWIRTLKYETHSFLSKETRELAL